MAPTARAAAAALLLTVAFGCGFTVHMLNTHRALQTFASTPLNPAFMEDIYANIGSVFAGRCVRWEVAQGVRGPARPCVLCRGPAFKSDLCVRIWPTPARAHWPASAVITGQRPPAVGGARSQVP